MARNTLFERIDPGWGSPFRRIGTVAAAIVICMSTAGAWLNDGINQGLGVTVFLVVISVLGGSVIAFAVYMNFIRRRGHRERESRR